MASTSSSLFNQTFSANDPSVNPILANTEPCSYYNQPSSIHSYKTKDLLIVHINIRSILKNFGNLSHFLSQFSTSPDIICLTETRLNKNPLIYINIPGYQFVYANSTSLYGVGICVSSQIDFDMSAKNKLDVNCEDLWISLNGKKIHKKIIIATIYRHLSSDAKPFMEALNSTLLEPKILNSTIFLLGDFSINISQSCRSSTAQNYLDMLSSHALYPTNTRPTRITPNSSAIIDHIITNCNSHHISPGIIESDLTVHYSVFCIIQNTITSKRHNKYYY